MPPNLADKTVSPAVFKRCQLKQKPEKDNMPAYIETLFPERKKKWDTSSLYL